MRFGVFLLLNLVFFQSFGNHNTTPQDSLAIWLQAVQKNQSISIKEKEVYLERALQGLENSNPAALSSISSGALLSGDSALFRKYNKRVIQLTAKLGEDKAHAFAHWDLGDFLQKTVPDSAFYHYQEAYTIFSEMDLDESSNHYPGTLLLAIGQLQDKIKDYIGAEKSYITAIQYFEKIGRQDKLYVAYNGLGIAQNGMKKFDKAIEYYNKARLYIPKMPSNQQDRAFRSLENNIASANLRKGDFNTSYTLFSQLKERDGLFESNPKLYAKVLASWGYTGFKSGIGEFEAYEKAFERSNAILDSIGNQSDKARNYEYYAKVLAGKNDIPNAIKKALIAKRIAQETFNNDRLLSVLELLTRLDKKNSNQYAQTYFDLNEELQLKERGIRDKFARIRMETDEIIENNASLQKRNELYVGLFIAFIIAGIGVFVIVSQRINNQRLKFKQKQQESNQEIYNLLLTQQAKLEEGKKSEQKRVSEELHDGILGQLLGIRLIMSGLNERNDDSSIQQRAELIQKLQEVEEEIRTISHELNASSYEKMESFVNSIKDLIQDTLTASEVGINFEYNQSFDWEALSSDLKINIYRIVQECLNNCIKHAKCDKIDVNFDSDSKTVSLNIIDNGIGFNVAAFKSGIGIRNIKSRLKKIDGLLELDSSPKKGTKILIQVPIKKKLGGNLKTNKLRTSVQQI